MTGQQVKGLSSAIAKMLELMQKHDDLDGTFLNGYNERIQKIERSYHMYTRYGPRSFPGVNEEPMGELSFLPLETETECKPSDKFGMDMPSWYYGPGFYLMDLENFLFVFVPAPPF